MAIYSPMLTAVVIAAFPFYILISAAATPVFRNRLDEKFQRGAENQAFLVESVTGVETLESMAVEPQMQRRWEEQLAGYVSASFRVLSLGNVATESVQLINKVVTALILFLGARSVMDGSLTVGELVAFNMLASRVNTPVLRLAQIWQDFHQTRLSVARLGDILNTAPSRNLRRGARRFLRSRATSPLSMSASATASTARKSSPISRFPSPRAKSWALSGPQARARARSRSSSSGSTCPKAAACLSTASISRLPIPPGSGGRRPSFLQENILFNRTVRDNIALAEPTAPMTPVIAAATLAGAHEFIVQLPEGYDTIIGERGSTLSGGQRQRIAIARALMTNPRILIFDEATSALDYESERAIQANMAGIARGRTVIIIAHRLSTVRSAHRILTLDKGRLVEDGTHDQLVNTGGRYASLHRIQAGLYEVA